MKEERILTAGYCGLACKACSDSGSKIANTFARKHGDIIK